ncbi:uncharacterized protein LOC122505072 [Leptopilina heterotoma]|uniref:uncharacterized protein LOC122505072 n=1 Tax=Leptopilina heterotoma TaxID=63436 RepID=UPI001CA868A1|nr:uncharacterized protein LOC122505072 [Leptopilina heterotoma]
MRQEMQEKDRDIERLEWEIRRLCEKKDERQENTHKEDEKKTEINEGKNTERNFRRRQKMKENDKEISRLQWENRRLIEKNKELYEEQKIRYSGRSRINNQRYTNLPYYTKKFRPPGQFQSRNSCQQYIPKINYAQQRACTQPPTCHTHTQYSPNFQYSQNTRCTEHSPYSSLPDLQKEIKPILSTQEHLQLIYRDSENATKNDDEVGHWCCIHYVNHKLRIYDSLYNNLNELQNIYLSILFPHCPKIVFPFVQRQSNGIDCGVFAIAFATSIMLGKDPYLTDCYQNNVCLNDEHLEQNKVSIYTHETVRSSLHNSSTNIFLEKIKATTNIRKDIIIRKIDVLDENNKVLRIGNNWKVKGDIPRLALCNGLMFPNIPEVLSVLTPLEERLVSPRHIFLKIVRKGQGIGFQHGLTGTVINVPVDVDTMVNALPRNVSDHNVITIELKRKMCYKHGRKEVICPEKVRAAAKYLTNTELFRELEIIFDDSWQCEENNEESSILTQVECTCKENIEFEEMPINPSNVETLLDKEQDVVITMAPGEGKRPIYLLNDQNLEELAFIKIHRGNKRNFSVKLSHSEIIKSEISRFDRRAMRIDYLFTALKKQQMSQITSNISTCLRKKSLKGVPIFASNLLDDNYIESLIQHDDGYKVLKGIRNSPAHWEGEKKKVLGMVRQFGVPSLFVTLSAAETKWPHLIKQLMKIVDGIDVTLNEADDLSYETKVRLIQSDPFTCVTFFECRLKELRKTWNSPVGPFGEYKIEHFYYRIEFQHRGSPHAHIMLWLKDAPIFKPGDATSVNAVTLFVDKIISCSSDEIITTLSNLQQHVHTHTCRKNFNRKCRFGIPFFPMDKTRLLLELDDDNDIIKYKRLGKTLIKQLEDIPPSICTFEEYLAYTQLQLNDYILAVRATLKRPKIILKRSPIDIYLNPYSKKILELQQSNMDIQFILDPFACSIYIVDYINKADRGMSKLLRSAVDEAKQGNKGVKEVLRVVSNAFLNSSEISAQEAVYCLAGLPLSRSSETEIFINTSHPSQRVHILKGRKYLEKLDSFSTDIFEKNLIDHYANRPVDDRFDVMCLAYFAAYYMYAKTIKDKKNNIKNENNENYDEANIDNIEENVHKSSWIKLLNNDGYVRYRKNPRVIRFRRYNKETDPENFYREQLMLYVPWRNEELELLNNEINIKDRYYSFKDVISKESRQFNKLGDAEEFEIFLNSVRDATAKQSAEEEDEENINSNNRPLDGFEYENEDGDVDHELQFSDVLLESSETDANIVTAQPPVINQENVNSLIRILNSDQRDFILHVANYFQNKTVNSPPLYLFVNGGAGVGKSLLIKTLFQHLMVYYFNRIPGSDPDELKIILSAYTGKAAFGIGGQTVHSIFGLPISQCGYTMPELSPSTSNTLACKLKSVNLIILDEISMLGSKTLYQINRRLQQIFHTNEPFAGISIIAVGDFQQLPPVGDNWVFQPNTRANPMAVIAGNPLWEQFKLFHMTQIMRQKDDLSFATALNNMASGTMSSTDINLIQNRCFTINLLPPEAEGAIHLFASNKEVDDFNNKILSKMNTDGAKINAIDIVSGAPNFQAKRKALKSVKDLSRMQTYGLPKSLSIKIGARFMITVNIDTSDGVVNGTSGILKAIDFGKHKITEGITIHKSQGATMDKVVVHVNQNVRRSMLYVACSRARTASGLFIVIKNGKFQAPSPPQNDNPVIVEMNRLESSSPLVPCYRFLRNVPNDIIQIIFHNVQSLCKHVDDIDSDPIIKASHVLFFVETWSCELHNFHLNGFSEMIRINGPSEKNSNPGWGPVQDPDRIPCRKLGQGSCAGSDAGTLAIKGSCKSSCTGTLAGSCTGNFVKVPAQEPLQFCKLQFPVHDPASVPVQELLQEPLIAKVPASEPAQEPCSNFLHGIRSGSCAGRVRDPVGNLHRTCKGSREDPLRILYGDFNLS